MTTISSTDYWIDQAKRRLKPTPVTIPGMGSVEKRLLAHDFKEITLAEPPAGSGLKAVKGDQGLPILAHMIEMFRGGPDFILHQYRKWGPIYYSGSQVLPAVGALGPDATQAVFSNRNKDFSQRAWDPVIGPFFEGGLMLRDFDDHMYHRRIMQEAYNVTVRMGDVQVSPGDVVVADINGVVFIPPSKLEDVVARAETLMEKEEQMKADLLAVRPPSGPCARRKPNSNTVSSCAARRIRDALVAIKLEKLTRLRRAVSIN